MNIIVFTDLHLKNYSSYSSILPNGINSRLQEGLDVLDQIKRYANEHSAEYCINLGDLFDRVLVNPEELNLTYRKLLEFRCKIIMLLGNHDYIRRRNSKWSVLEVLESDKIHIVKDVERKEIGGRSIGFIPYTEEREFIEDAMNMEGTDILFIHQGISGFNPGTGISLKTNIPINVFRGNKLVVSGHYHKYQKLGDFMYLGSPIQHNFGEEGNESHIMLLRTKSLTYDLLPIRSPRFIKLTYPIKEYKDYGLAYIKVLAPYDLSQQERENIVGELKSRGAKWVDIESTKKEIDKIVESKRLDNEVIEEYVKSFNNLKDKDEIIRVGKEILRGVE